MRRKHVIAGVVAATTLMGAAAVVNHNSPASTYPSSAAATAGAPVPDPTLTPGAPDPSVNQSNIHSTICVPGYSSGVRNVPAAEKDQVFAEYHVTQPHALFEIDHLVSLEIGGSNDIKNLWPQPWLGPYGAHAKDAVENRLHREVCAGTLSLADAQKAIATHWWSAP